jgi:hypothetical protein
MLALAWWSLLQRNLFSDFSFLEQPSAAIMAEGRSMARKGKRSGEPLMSGSVALHHRWEGLNRQASDLAITLSPMTVARWLGYWSECLGWTKEEVDSRWSSFARITGGKYFTVVRLTAYPFEDYFELSATRETRLSDLDDVTIGTPGAPSQVVWLTRPLWGSEPGFEGDDLWISDPRFLALNPGTGTKSPTDYDFRVGRYGTRYALVITDAPKYSLMVRKKGGITRAEISFLPKPARRRR